MNNLETLADELSVYLKKQPLKPASELLPSGYSINSSSTPSLKFDFMAWLLFETQTGIILVKQRVLNEGSDTIIMFERTDSMVTTVMSGYLGEVMVGAILTNASTFGLNRSQLESSLWELTK